MTTEALQTGTIFNIQRYAVHDGPGIRTTVFLKGCPLRCRWCHNPESQRMECERMTRTVRLDDETQVADTEIIGKVVSVSDVMQALEKDVIFFDESGGGVTFSGGEPLAQPEFLHALLQRCQAQAIHTSVDTSGFATSETFAALLDEIDLFLYDLKLIDDTLHRRYTGVSNALPLRNLQQLCRRGKRVWLRFPVIPTITDTERNVQDILEFISTLRGVRQINLLPYHNIADGKYQRFGIKNRMNGIQPPSDEQMAALREQFEQHGVKAVIGG